MPLFLNHPLLADLNHLYTRYATEIMLHQYMMSHDVKIELQSITTSLPRDATITVQDVDRRSNYVFVEAINADLFSITCSCEFYASHQMFCSHIFCVLNAY
jgi:hypothetical protein